MTLKDRLKNEPDPPVPAPRPARDDIGYEEVERDSRSLLDVLDDRPPVPRPPLDLQATSRGADPEQVSIHVAINRVMRDLRPVGKGDRYDDNRTRFDFRGIDRVVNAVEPVFERHGVFAVPQVQEVSYRDVPRASGPGRNSECRMKVRYCFYGPQGDCVVAEVQGEALDTSDKGTTKAMSVAWRNALIQVLALPTQAPDPDDTVIDRGGPPDEVAPSAESYRDEIVDQWTAMSRLRQIRSELRQHHLTEVEVTNEVGESETLGALVSRFGSKRWESGER